MAGLYIPIICRAGESAVQDCWILSWGRGNVLMGSAQDDLDVHWVARCGDFLARSAEVEEAWCCEGDGGLVEVDWELFD